MMLLATSHILLRTSSSVSSRMLPSHLRVGAACRKLSNTRATFSKSRVRPPYRILFCGGDDFSIGVLSVLLKNGGKLPPVEGATKVLLTEKDVENKSKTEVNGLPDICSPGRKSGVLPLDGLIESISVLTNSPKVIGRGAKNEVSTKQVISPIKESSQPAASVNKSSSSKKGLQVIRPPLHDYALQNGLSVHLLPDHGTVKAWELPESFKANDVGQTVSPLLITASFGHIIPERLLRQFPDPATRLNVHPSTLPKYRGASPIQWAIASGDTETGVSVQSLALPGSSQGAGVDTGELWQVQDHLAISANDTYFSLLPKLAEIGGNLLVQHLVAIAQGQATSRPQDPDCASRAPKIRIQDALIDPSEMSADEIERRHRAFGHQHPTWIQFVDKPLQVFNVSLFSPDEQVAATMISRLRSLAVGCALLDKRSGHAPRLLLRCKPDSATSLSEDESFLEIGAVKPSGKKLLAVDAWFAGVRHPQKLEKDVVRLE